MTEYAALALYPLCAITVLLGLTALRLGRSRPMGLVSLALVHAIWIAGLILLEHPVTIPVAERVLPAGMLLGGAFVHAGQDLFELRSRWPMWLAYGWGAVIALIGAAWPRTLYGPGVLDAGPLFWPAAAISGIALTVTVVWTIAAARSDHGARARRRWVLAAANIFATLGGGVAITVHIFGLADIKWAAPFLLGAIALAGYALLSSEHGRSRRLVQQGLVYSVMTAVLSAAGIVVYFELLPHITPGAGRSLMWVLIVTFFATLPLDSLRMLLVETTGRWLFDKPMGVRDLADEARSSETRADQAERLAEIGALASAVAHEIRNPLGVITAQASLLERRGADPKSVASLRQQVDRASVFVDDLLKYSRPRPLDTVAVPVAETIEAVIADLRLSGSPSIAVAVDGALTIEADESAFRDVLLILLQNAIAALDGRSDGAIEIRATRDDGAVSVSVTDNGPGVPREIEDQLFVPFVTGRGRDSNYPGTGLGLAIATRWVERHDGTLVHQRPDNGGARFVCSWPAR